MAKPLLSEQDVQFYRDHGYLFTPRIFSDEQLDAAIVAQDRFYRGDHAQWPFKKIPICGWKPGDDSQLRTNDYASVIIPELRELILDSRLGQMASLLCGEKVRLWQDQLSLKKAGDLTNGSVIGWHSDAQYWDCCSSQNMLTAWIALVDMEIDMGPIMYLDRSFLWSDIKGMSFFDTDHSALEKAIQNQGHETKRVPAIIQRGHVSFHHCRTLHGSGANRSSRERRALAVHMQPVSNRLVENKFHIVKILCSELGIKEYDHPLLFPELG